MKNNYTQEAKQNCLGLVDKGIDAIWDDINSLPEDSEPDLWRKKLQKIAKEYTFSSRYSLMRWLLGRVSENQLVDKNDPEKGYTVVLDDGSIVRFDEIDIAHAISLSKEELINYETLLMSIAERQADADYEYDLAIIQKALTVDQKKNTLLSREEAFILGHILRFSLEDMEWFLLRVCDVEGGFRYNKSNDLIEAYGFLSDLSWKKVEEIKEEYISHYGDINNKSIDEKENDWTRGVEGSLPMQVRLWPEDDQLKCFMKWIGERSPYLNCISKTTVRIYRNIAVYVFDILSCITEVPFEKDFSVSVRKQSQLLEEDYRTKEVLYENGEVSFEKCNLVANLLLTENRDFSLSDEKNIAKALRYITIDDQGKLKNKNAYIELLNDGSVRKKNGDIKKTYSTNRIVQLLMAKCEVEKTDILFLLWLLANQCWFDNSDNVTGESVGNRVLDFIEAAENCLNMARLPGFYPPHIIEQSMLLSIVYSFTGPEKSDPAEIYEMACSSIIERRAKHTNKKKK